MKTSDFLPPTPIRMPGDTYDSYCRVCKKVTKHIHNHNGHGECLKCNPQKEPYA